MKTFLKILKWTGITTGGIVILSIIFITAFVNMSPQFGEPPADAQQESFTKLPYYRDGKFENQIPTSVGLGFRKTVSVMYDFLFASIPGRNPDGPLPIDRLDSTEVSHRAMDIARLTWFGHSACLLEIDGSKILIDPMLGQFAGPLPMLSPRRYNRELPLEIEAMPFIDAVLISHDHYDHLDHGSILKLKNKVGHFFVPLGVGAHLRSWGVREEQITELKWWDEARYKGFNFVCTPARHFSGRAFTNNTTLWASWIIQSATKRIFFSGDSGYGPHFKEIGQKYGPFDFVMMECGQYNPLWSAIHMMPEETVQATLDVKGELLLPIHWGAFSLAMHTWRDPVIRVKQEAERLNLKLTTPQIGEAILLDAASVPQSVWW